MEKILEKIRKNGKLILIHQIINKEIFLWFLFKFFNELIFAIENWTSGNGAAD